MDREMFDHMKLISYHLVAYLASQFHHSAVPIVFCVWKELDSEFILNRLL